MTDYSPFRGALRKTDPPMQLARTLWTMGSSGGRVISAAIYIVRTGRELRVQAGEELLESRLSRTGDAALEARAAEIGRLLRAKGWSERD